MTHTMDDSNGGVDRIIDNYRMAVKERQSARTLIAIMAIFVLGVFVGLIWNSLNNFKRNTLPRLDEQVASNVDELMPRMLEHLGSSLNDLAPAYAQAYQEAFIRDKSVYGDVLMQECKALDSFLAEHASEIQEAIDRMIVMHQGIIMRELEPQLGLEKSQEVARAYEYNLRAELDSLSYDFREPNKRRFKSTLGDEHAAGSAKHFITSSQLSVGRFLELLGLEMQLKSNPI